MEGRAHSAVSQDTTVLRLTRTRLLPVHAPRKCEMIRRPFLPLPERTREERLRLLHTRQFPAADRAFRIEPSPYVNSLRWIVPAPRSSPYAGRYWDGNGGLRGRLSSEQRPSLT